MAVKKIDETPEVTEDPWADEAPTNYGVEHSPDRDFLTVTVKAGTGFDSPWLVLHANSVREAIEVLEDDDWATLVDLTGTRAKEFQRAYGGPQAASKSSSGGGWASKAKAPSRASQPDPEDFLDDDDCEHGRNWVTGKSGKGPWYAWMCQSKSSRDKCDPLWANKDGSLQER